MTSIEALFEQKFVSLINSRINSGKECEKFLLKTYDFNSIAFKMEIISEITFEFGRIELISPLLF